MDLKGQWGAVGGAGAKRGHEGHSGRCGSGSEQAHVHFTTCYACVQQCTVVLQALRLLLLLLYAFLARCTVGGWEAGSGSIQCSILAAASTGWTTTPGATVAAASVAWVHADIICSSASNRGIW